MQALYKITIDEYLEIIELAKQAGIKAGESLEPIIFAYMKKKGQKPFTHTELNHEELLNELSRDNKILDVNVSSEGKTSYKFIEKQNKNKQNE